MTVIVDSIIRLSFSWEIIKFNTKGLNLIYIIIDKIYVSKKNIGRLVLCPS